MIRGGHLQSHADRTGSGRASRAQQATQASQAPVALGAEMLSLASAQEALKARGLLAKHVVVRGRNGHPIGRVGCGRVGPPGHHTHLVQYAWIIYRASNLEGLWFSRRPDLPRAVMDLLVYARRHGTAKLRTFSTGYYVKRKEEGE